MTDQTSQRTTEAPSSTLTPQQIAAVGAVIAFLATFALNQGWISKDTYDWLVSPTSLAAIVAVAGAGITAYIAYASRPHGMIKTTNSLGQVEAVIVKPKTADEIDVKGVVASAEEAAPFVKATRHRAPHVTPPAANS